MAGIIQTVVPRLIEFGLNTGQRREEQRRWKQYGEPMAKQQLYESQIRWGTEGKEGLEHRKIKLNEDTLKQRSLELTKHLENEAANRGIRLNEDQTRRLKISSDIFLHSAQYGDDDLTNRIWDNSPLGETFGKGMGLHFDHKKPGEIRTGISDSGIAWKWDITKPGGPETYDMSKQGLGKRGNAPDLKTGLTSILTKYKSPGSTGYADPETEEGQNAYRNMMTAAQNPEHPQHEQAKADYLDYMKIENRMREIMDLQGRSLPTQEEQARQERQYWLKKAYPESRLQNIGGPIVPSDANKRIVRTGTDPDTGKKVVMYEDGTIEYDTRTRNY
jgi:hypothetical protein